MGILWVPIFVLFSLASTQDASSSFAVSSFGDLLRHPSQTPKLLSHHHKTESAYLCVCGPSLETGTSAVSDADSFGIFTGN